jgi:hypothetical protein
MSFIQNFNDISRGVFGLPNLVFYVSMIVFFLFANAIIVEQKKAD